MSRQDADGQRWPSSLALILLAPVVDFLPSLINGLWLGLVLIAIPMAIGVAVLRYRLYDIDLVINRTLVYGPLTAMLVLVYVGGVVTIQSTFRTTDRSGIPDRRRRLHACHRRPVRPAAQTAADVRG